MVLLHPSDELLPERWKHIQRVSDVNRKKYHKEHLE